MLPPVITVDGPSASGKGTISRLIARALKWHWLDSGAVYRAIAWAIAEQKIELTNEAALTQLLNSLTMKIIETPDAPNPLQVICNQQDITAFIRLESIAQLASKSSAIPKVREAAMKWQRAFRQIPGLVTDGRDMGTVVFPDADLKIYLEASSEERAKRRFSELQAQSVPVTYAEILADMQARDERDRNRTVAPTKPAADAVIIDTTGLSIEQVMQKVMALAQHFVL